MNATHSNDIEIPSVCLSHTVFVWKRLNLLSKFFHHLLAPSF